MRRKWILIACVLVLGMIPVTQPSKGQAAQIKYDGTSSTEQNKALASINKLRQQTGLAPVKLDPALVKSAVNHARYANAHYTLESTGNLSAEAKGRQFYTRPTAEERAHAAGYGRAGEILETVYMKERAYDEFDMASEIRELSLVHDRREVMLNPAVSALGIARVEKATVIVGAVLGEDVANAPASISVYPYDGATDVWPGLFEKVDVEKLIQGVGEGTTITVFTTQKDVSGFKASLSTQAGNRRIDIPLSVQKLDSGYGYVLTAQRQLRGNREYTAEVSFQSGGVTLEKRWSFQAGTFQFPLNIDDMPLVNAPFLNIVNGRAEVPMRYLFELFGASVEWEPATRTITAVRNEMSLHMTIDSPAASINGQAVQLDSPPHLYGNATFVPLRFISEAFGYEVGYDPIGHTVDIWTGLLENPDGATNA